MNISTEYQTTTHIGTVCYQINTPPFEILMDHMISHTPTFAWIQRQASENVCTPGEQDEVAIIAKVYLNTLVKQNSQAQT